MFTGLVEGIGKIRRIRRIRNELTLTVEPPFPVSECRPGDSVAVNGVCLTITELSEQAFRVDVSGETISHSTLGRLKQGFEVNLERALRLSDRLGGHLVAGHVDGLGRVIQKEPQQRSWKMRIGIEPHLSRYVVKKGSIAVDGISLTVNLCGKDFFEVNVIVQTGKETTLLDRRIGDWVNIETDMIGKYVEKLLFADRSARDNPSGSGIDLEMLIKNGFGD